jgi:Tfp pilus assembly protein PilX
MTHHNLTSKKGFALLMTLMVVSVIISITAAVIQLSMKQLQLAVTTRDSEIAFQAANAGMECARYARRVLATPLEDPESYSSYPSFQCFGENQNLAITEVSGLLYNGSSNLDSDEGTVTYYESDLSWSTGDRCSKMKMLVINVNPDAATSLVIKNIHDIFPGYPKNQDKTCEIGSFCTIAQVTGYSEGTMCNPGQMPTLDTIRREILLEF